MSAPKLGNQPEPKLIASSVSRYGVPRKFSDNGPFENPQNLHLNVHTFV